eukprot:1153945-Pelagomonas_calceolata.AAC.2
MISRTRKLADRQEDARSQRAGARGAKPGALVVVIQGLSLFGDGFNFSLPHARRIPQIQPTESPILTFLCLERIESPILTFVPGAY